MTGIVSKIIGFYSNTEMIKLIRLLNRQNQAN